MKQRFSSLDIKVIAHELSKTITSLRVSNIYDLSSRIFLFKFAASGRKELFVVDSGFRCHLSKYARTTAATPSAFVSRLRKFLSSRRVTKVAQVGTDRILQFTFSDGQYHLFLEFYAGGNIVLTDAEYKVIALQRNVNEGAEHEHLRVGASYNLSERQNVNGIPPMTKERLKDGLQKFIERQAAGQQSTNKKLKKKPGDAMRKALGSSINEYPPMLLDHSLRQVDFDIASRPEDVVQSEELLDKLLLAMGEAQKLVDEVMSRDVVTGYIFGKPAPGKESNNESRAQESGEINIMYEDFHPFKPKHIAEDQSNKTLEFEGFNRTVDEFYSSIEGQRLESRLAEKEANARKKLEHAKQDQKSRLSGLQQVQELNVRKAQAIEANLEWVKEATAAVNGLISQGMDWDEVDKLVELEQKRNNPVAQLIKLPLKLKENTVTLRLADWEAEDQDDEKDEGYVSTDASPSESEDEAQPSKKSKKPKQAAASPEEKRLNVDIDLSLSAWSNAREYYDHKRTAASKEEKTMQASAKALKSTQRKVEADLKKALKQEKQTLREVRKPFWFEKFTYFISSDGYLVLGARDGQQADLLYKKYLKPGDAWIHADLDQAMPVVVKNRVASADAPIPPGTLSQAGNLSVATSKAWDSKAVMSAWWVPANQVSKKASTGDYLQPGRFEVKGSKNFLPPVQLLLGFAVLFQISEASKARHMKHRVQDEQSPAQNADVDASAAISAPDENASVASANPDEVDADGAGEAEGSADNDGVEEGDSSESEPGSVEQEHADEDGDDGAYVNPLQPSGANEEQDDASKVVANGEQNDKADGEVAESDADDDSSDGEEESPPIAPASNATGEPAIKTKGPIPVRGKKGKKKKIAQKYADQDEQDREEAMRVLGSAAGQQKQQQEALSKEARDKEAEAQRQRRREQHQRAQARRAKQDDQAPADDEEEDIDTNVDLDTLVGTPLPGDEILEAVPICAPWGALGRYKYKAKLQPGSEKKGKAVRTILGKWGADAAKKAVDEKAEDVERIWPREMELIKGWQEAAIFGVVPVGKVRVMMSGASSAGKGGAQKKSKKPSGRGSKKQR